MKESDIDRFFKNHKQSIEDDGFSQRLFSTLECLPQPKPRKKVVNSYVLTAIFAAIGFIIFMVTGGYSLIIDQFSQVGTIVHNYKSISPEMIISVVIIFMSLFGVAKFALDWE